MRAVCARSGALAHARRHPGDGAFAAAHRAAGDSRRLARRQAAHRRRPLPRGVLGRGARRGGRRDQAGARQVRRHGDPRRLLRLVLGRAVAPRAQPAAAFPVPRRRLRRPGRQLQLRHGDVPAAAGDRHLPAGDRPGHRLVVDHQAHAADHRLRRAGDQERPGDVGRRQRACHGDVAAPRQGGWDRIRLGEPAQDRRARFPRRPMGADPAEHRHRLDAGDGAHIVGRRPPRRAIRGALLRGLRALPPLPARARRRRAEGRRMGGRDHRRSAPTPFAISRAAPPRPAA